MNEENPLHSLHLKFKSGNKIPVDRAMISRQEWESILGIANTLAWVLDGVENHDLESNFPGIDEEQAIISKQIATEFFFQHPGK